MVRLIHTNLCNVKEKKMSIYIVTHKKYNFPGMKNYIPIQVGAAYHEDLGFCKDSEGDNISLKNPHYCELTALYFMWKNTNDNIIGLTHYRRYFCNKKTLTPLKHILSYDDAANILKKYDIIVPYKMHRQGKTIRQDYAINHNIRDYDECEKIIIKYFPKYKESFDRVSDSKDLYQYNMFITKRAVFDSYCSWLFKILFELEKRIDISNYDKYNSRVYGFLSERLFNVWLDYNKQLKVKKFEVYNIEENKLSLLKANIKNIIKPIIGMER